MHVHEALLSSEHECSHCTNAGFCQDHADTFTACVNTLVRLQRICVLPHLDAIPILGKRTLLKFRI